MRWWKPARVCMYTHGCVCFGVCVCGFSLAPLGGLGVPRFDRARLWVVAFGPHLPGSRNLSCNLLRQWGEHVKPWHMVARVTCSLCLSLIFRPSEQTRPTQRDTCTAPPALRFGKHPLFTTWELLVHRTLLRVDLRRFSGPKFIPPNGVLSGEFLFFCVFCVFLCVCVFAVCLLQTKGWLGLCHQISIHLQFFNYSQANLTFKSPTHMYWTAVLSPVQILKRGSERSREREREGGKEWNGKISQPLVTGWGAEKNSAQLSKPSQIQDFTCTLFSPLFSLLIHSLFL